jgi:hypothetical protein
MRRFIEWDSLDLRISGAKLDELLLADVRREPMIERIGLYFMNGLLRVTGSVRKGISIPFAIEITHIHTQGTTVRVPLSRVTAGPLPIPKLLVSLVSGRLPPELVSYEEPATFVVSLDRFLPPFVAADIQKIWIIEGGLAVTLGRGGADLPGGMDGNERSSGQRV